MRSLPEKTTELTVGRVVSPSQYVGPLAPRCMMIANQKADDIRMYESCFEELEWDHVAEVNS